MARAHCGAAKQHDLFDSQLLSINVSIFVAEFINLGRDIEVFLSVHPDVVSSRPLKFYVKL
jgi:hypothetical protein